MCNVRNHGLPQNSKHGPKARHDPCWARARPTQAATHLARLQHSHVSGPSSSGSIVRSCLLGHNRHLRLLAAGTVGPTARLRVRRKATHTPHGHAAQSVLARDVGAKCRPWRCTAQEGGCTRDHTAPGTRCRCPNTRTSPNHGGCGGTDAVRQGKNPALRNTQRRPQLQSNDDRAHRSALLPMPPLQPRPSASLTPQQALLRANDRSTQLEQKLPPCAHTRINSGKNEQTWGSDRSRLVSVWCARLRAAAIVAPPARAVVNRQPARCWHLCCDPAAGWLGVPNVRAARLQAPRVVTSCQCPPTRCYPAPLLHAPP